MSTGPGPADAVEQLDVACRSASAIHISWKVNSNTACFSFSVTLN